MRQEHSGDFLAVMLVACGIPVVGAAVGMLICYCCGCYGAEPPRKPQLCIAIDDSPQSVQLKSELVRDWTKPNPALHLTDKQWRDVAKRAFRFNAVQAEIRKHFDVNFVEGDKCPISIAKPAVRVGRGPWESIDKRAFAFEGRALFTVDWLRVQHEALFAQGKPKADTMPFWMCCNAEGYSGSTATFLPPWETKEAFPAYRTSDGCEDSE